VNRIHYIATYRGGIPRLLKRTHRMYRVFLLFVAVVLSAGTAFGQPMQPQPWWPVQPVELPLVHTLFSSHMVLQRNIAAPIWGWSTPGDKITVSINDEQIAKATAEKDGKWQTTIGPFPTGGPVTLSIAGEKKTVTLNDVLVGDVWLCSGQSNMNWPVRLSLNAEEEVKAANHPEIRSFNVGFYPSLVPMKLPQPAQWEQCTPEFARNFTGVGYFFAREIQKSQRIPIGIIHSSVGATYAEAWVSGEALRKQMPHDFGELLDAVDLGAAAGGENFDYFGAIEKWTATVDP